MSFPTSPNDGDLYTNANNTIFQYVAADDKWVKLTDETFDIVNDTTPQLGGDLDLNGHSIPGLSGWAIRGLVLSNDAGDTDHDINITAGACMDAGWTKTMSLAGEITKQIDASWAVGDDAGGMDTGAVAANTWYYVWLIRKDSDGSIDALFSLSKTTPTMPAGYTYKRRISAVLTNATSNILLFYQHGNEFRFKIMISNKAWALIPNNTRNLLTVSVPPDFMGVFNHQGYTSTNVRHLVVHAVRETDFVPIATMNTFYPFPGISNIENHIYVDSNSQIAYRADVAHVIWYMTKTLGWIDLRES